MELSSLYTRCAGRSLGNPGQWVNFMEDEPSRFSRIRGRSKVSHATSIVHRGNTCPLAWRFVMVKVQMCGVKVQLMLLNIYRSDEGKSIGRMNKRRAAPPLVS